MTNQYTMLFLNRKKIWLESLGLEKNRHEDIADKYRYKHTNCYDCSW